MRSFLTRISLFLGLQMVVAAYVLHQGNPADEDHFYRAMYDKLDRMEQADVSESVEV